MKFAIFFTLLAVVALGNGSILPLHKKGDTNNGAINNDVSPNFGSALMSFILAFQKIMPCGFSNWNLPPLAPFTMDNLPLDFHNQFYSVTGNIANIVVNGMNDFRILKFNYDQNTGIITYDVIYYDMQILGEYDMEAWAMLAGYNATMAGNGPLSWEVKNLRAFGQVTMGPNGGDGSMISDFYMNFLVGDVIPGSWNYKWDISFNNFANRWFRDFILMWVEQSQEVVNDVYNKVILPKENQSLENINMSEIINFFTQQTQLMNEANCPSTQS